MKPRKLFLGRQTQGRFRGFSLGVDNSPLPMFLWQHQPTRRNLSL
ncbi:hypothetical protein L6F15_003523 [Proteus mirabilis]